MQIPPTQTKVVGFLQDANNYSHASHNLLVAETNQSLVFLVGDYAYKLFKAIARYRDNSTAQARHDNAQLEMDANKPLAADLYIGILAIVKNADGSLGFAELGTEGGRTVLDYVVKMHRFDDEALMYTRLFNNSLTTADLRALGCHVATFHKNQPEMRPDPGSYFGAFRADFDHWVHAFAGKMTCPQARAMLWQLREPGLEMIDGTRTTFNVRELHWRTLHGDMDFGNIATFKGRLLPFDAQVLFDGKRENDTAKDVGYMVAPLLMYGRTDLAQALIEGYKSVIPTDTLDLVLPLWAAYAAMVRGSSWLSRAATVSDPTEGARLEAFGYRYLKTALRLLNGELKLV